MKYLVIVLLLTISSCKSVKPHKKIMIDKFNQYTTEDVFSLLPIKNIIIENSLSQNIIFPEAIYASNYCGVFIEYNHNSDEYNKILDYIKEGNFFESSITDSCNIYIPRIKEIEECSENYVPVPNTKDDFNELKNKINEGKYIVFNHKKGVFLKDEAFLTGNSHGFSNGIILEDSTNKVFYWVVIW